MTVRRKTINTLMTLVASGLLLVSFQNCGDQQFGFASAGHKVGDIGGEVDICTTTLDCQPNLPGDQNNGGDSDPVDPVDPPPANPPPANPPPANPPPTTPPPANPPPQPLPFVACKDADKSSFIDAVLKVDRLILVGLSGQVEVLNPGNVSLNGIEIKLPDSLKDQKVKMRLEIASSGHYFVSRKDYLVEMNVVTALRSDSRFIEVEVVKAPNGNYLVSADWMSRLHPGKNKCGLLPLENGNGP